MIQTQMIQTEWQTRAATASSVSDHPVLAHRASVPTTLVVDLTEREQEVLRFLADGLSNAQIGERLHLSPRTVEKYVSSLLRKTEMNNRAELVRFAFEHHLVD